VSRTNCEGAGSREPNPPKTLNNTHPDFASDDVHGKALATMKARAALCGCSLHEMADGGFLVGRWGYSKALPCLRAVGDLLRQIGGR